MYWRSNSATTSPFLASVPGLMVFWRTRPNSLPPPPPPLPPPPPPPPAPPAPASADAVDPRGSAAGAVLLDVEDVLLRVLVLPGLLTRLVEACSAADWLFPD